MRYFTKEMWGGLQEDVPTRDWVSEWRDNGRKYFRQLDRLQNRLDRVSFRFFRHVNMHDGRVVTLTILDRSGLRVSRGAKRLSDQRPVQVTIEAAPFASRKRVPPIYVLRYRGVRRVIVDHPSDQPLFHADVAGLGDWGYDELTQAGRQHLRHEILFASGGTISIECSGIAVRKRKG